MRKGIVIWALLAALALASACAPVTPPQIVRETVMVPGTPEVVERVITATPGSTATPQRPNVIRLSTDSSGDVPTVDPGLGENSISTTIVESTFVGLTRLDEATNELHPGVATRWDSSFDGKTFVFQLRRDVPWVKWDAAKKQVAKVQTCPDKSGKTADRMVTAKDFEYGILRVLRPETASPYAFAFVSLIQGADDFSAGKTKDASTVGVKALDEATLQVKVKEPAVYNAHLMGLWTAMAVPRWLIEGDECTTARKDKWTEPGMFQSYGPFTLKEWVHESTLTIVKNPFWPGDPWTPQPKVNEVSWLMLDPVASMAEFEAGNLDAATVPAAAIERVRTDAMLSKLWTVLPSLCTYAYGFNTKAKFVDDARVRRALSMAVDRKAILESVAAGDREPALWFSRPGLIGAPAPKDYPDLGIKFDQEGAKKLFDEYLKDKSLTVDKVDVTLAYNNTPGNQKIADAIQQQWKNYLGINVKPASKEQAAFFATVASREAPQIWWLGWCMDYPDANNFAREVVGMGGYDNPASGSTPVGGLHWKNDKYEDYVKKAALETDTKKRVDLYAQAEKILVYEDAAVIPLFWYDRNVVTQPWVKRTMPSGTNDRYEHWEIAQ